MSDELSKFPPSRHRNLVGRIAAIALGLAALSILVASLYHGAWPVLPFGGIVAYLAFGLWNGKLDGSNRNHGAVSQICSLDPIFDPEFKSSPANIHHHDYPHKTDPPPP